MPRLIAFVVVFVSSHWVFADAPTPAQVRQWILELDHPRFRVRDAATLKLQQAGVSAVDALMDPAKNGNAETSDRVMKILGEMAEARDEHTERAARKVLRQLSAESGSIASAARLILERRRNDYLARMELYQAVIIRQDDRVLRIHLEEVLAEDMPKLMPLLREFPETELLSAETKAFDDRAAKFLENLPNLRELNLFQSAIGDEGLKSVGTLRQLRRIPMGHTKVTDAGLKHLSKLTDLEYVGVRGNPITNEGLKNLRPLISLTGLNLGETKVTDAGLTELRRFPKLQTLYLDNTAITDAALPAVGWLKELESVTLMKTKTTFEGRSRLKEALPNLRITDEERDYP